MAKTSETAHQEPVAATKVVRDAKTGRSLVVRGFGALKGEDLKIKKSVSLLKPIAKQALRRAGKGKAG